jgi:aminoglycoside 3-N-acetyltransferase
MSKLFDYTLKDIIKSYKKLKIKKNEDVYISSNLISLGRYEKKSINHLLEDHLIAIRSVIGNEGTIFFPTATLNLCNSNIIFDYHNTPSYQMGILSEYLRKNKNSFRSMHPYWSVSGIGPNAKKFLQNLSPHSHASGSIWEKFAEKNIRAINIGVKPTHACPIIHYIETIVGVPYRYNKEFNQRIKTKKIEFKKFYLPVLYLKSRIIRDENKKIFKNFESHKKKVKKIKLGKGYIYSFSQKDFFIITKNYLQNNIYGWTKNEPKIKQYTKTM